MNPSNKPFRETPLNREYAAIRSRGWILALGLSLKLAAGFAETGQSFATPQAAVQALHLAVAGQDPAALRTLLGSAANDLENPDRVQATNELKAFNAALETTNRLVVQSPEKYVLDVGTNDWPFPIPIVQRQGRWIFDTQAGKEELLCRRIGRNELATLQAVRAYAEAQREYASRDRNGDQVLQYAQKLASSPGKTDGLYWPPEWEGELSPLGPLVAEAQAQGYALGRHGSAAQPIPFHGYYFKILTRQGKHAPGGKYNYLINGRMIAGFGLLAWPASYGESGIMTFEINQQGRVYQKDLGPQTAKLASRIQAYDPDSSWQLSPN